MSITHDKIYTEGQFVEFVELCFGSVLRTGAGDNVNYSVVCPICQETKGKEYNKKKLAIRLSGQAHLAKCWVCGHKSKNLLYLIKKYRSAFLQQYAEKFLDSKNLSTKDDKEMSEVAKEFGLPAGFVLLAQLDEMDIKTKALFRPYVSYLKLRYPEEFENGLLWKWKFGATIKDQYYKSRIIMPSFSNDGSLNYYTSRAVDGRMQPKYLNPFVARESIIFNEMELDWKKPLVVVEGPFDLIKCPVNSTCLLGSDLSEDYLLFQKIVVNQTSVILALDGDDVGRKKTEYIASMLYEYGVDVRVVEYPKGIKDPGELTCIQFNSLIDDAKLYSKAYSIRVKIANLL
jgi:DNA primase